MGFLALRFNTTGAYNTALGDSALRFHNTGDDNTAVGFNSLINNANGTNNIALGAEAGSSSTSGDNNIYIGNAGLANESGVIRIGDSQTQTFIAGVITGNGGGLTNLSVAQFSGTASINITGNAATATTTGSFSGPLSGDVTGTQSATVVSTVDGQSAASVASGVLAANGATSTDTPNTLVKRDATGSISITNFTLDGNLNLPVTTANGGVIYSGTNTLIHAYGLANFFGGAGAGNLAMATGAVGNTGIGYNALHNNTNGYLNTAVGSYTLESNTVGQVNVSIGNNALNSNTSGSANTAIGSGALQNNTIGDDNTANGAGALVRNTSGRFNTANGWGALANNTTGYFNTAVGTEAFEGDVNGSANIGLGYRAGWNVSGGSNNIEIGNVGTASDNNTILIGTQGVQTNTAIAGIYGATAASGVPVYVTSSGQLGTLTSSARFKQDIQQMDDASHALYALQPVTFKYKPGIDPQGTPQFGLVAEQVEKVAPDLVARDKTRASLTPSVIRPWTPCC